MTATASMGPSPLGDGKPAHGAMVPRSRSLQWGRRLLATERHLTEGRGGAEQRASMGPSPLGDGKLPDCGRPRCAESPASMGPSPLGDGKAEIHAFGAARSDASMGPSPLGDGKTVHGIAWELSRSLLQWGRRLLATERAKGAK